MDITMDLLTPERFNEYVIQQQRARSPSPCPKRAPSPIMMDTSCDSYNIPTPIPSIPCQSLLEQKCSHCGWLRKRRSINFLTWPQAYVVLHDGCLYYFKNERAKSASGKFSLYGYNFVFRASELQQKEAPWAFKIVHSLTEFKTYYFAASSEQEMKVWMIKVKNEMIIASGKSSVYGSILQAPITEEKPDPALFKDDTSFYNDVETSIYDDGTKFQLTNDYQKKCSIKKNDEESDDEDLCIPKFNPELDNRPPAPLPENQPPFVTLKTQAPLKPPRLPDTGQPPRYHSNNSATSSGFHSLPRPQAKHPVTSNNPPPTPPRKRSGGNSATDSHAEGSSRFVKDLANCLQSGLGTAQGNPKLRNRQNYEPTDIQSTQTPSPDKKMDHLSFFGTNTSLGDSTGEEDDQDPEEYWASAYFEDRDKDRASDIIQTLAEEGVYMVRPETSGSGKVLVVYAGDQPKKYRIQKTDDDKYFLAKDGYKDKLLENVLCYYYENNLPTVSVKLKKPFKQHPRYRSLQF